MTRPLIVLALISSFAAVGTVNATATTTTANFNVTITVLAGCEFTTDGGISDLAFGSVAATPLTGTAPVSTTQTSFDLQCTVGTAPEIALTSAHEWKMEGSDADNTEATISYTLYSDSARTTAWGDTATITGADTGAAQTHVVYGKVTDPGRVAGNFKDVVTVTLTY